MEEVQIVALNATAETANPGVTMIMIVKSGGNQFHGRYEATGESSALQSTNLTPTLRAEGVTTGNSINRYENVSADLGGPLKKHKLWFYGAYNLQQAYFVDYTANAPPAPEMYNLTPVFGACFSLYPSAPEHRTFGNDCIFPPGSFLGTHEIKAVAITFGR